MSVLHLLSAGNYIVVNRSLIHLLGLEAAVMLGELASEFFYWQERDTTQDGWFYSTIENVEHNTGLSGYNQRIAITKLSDAGLVEVKKMGMPAKRYIRINEPQVIKLFNDQLLKNLTTSDKKSELQVVEKFEVNNNRDKKNKEKELSKKDRINKMTYEQVLDYYEFIKNNPELRNACLEYVEMRKQIKAPLTSYALYLNMNDAYKIAEGDLTVMKQVIEQSIKESWRGIFPLRSKQQNVQIIGQENEFTTLLKKEGYSDDS